ADPRFHPFEQLATFDAALDWIRTHEPQLAEAVEARVDSLEDFLRVENFAYSCERVFSPDRWCMSGISGVFVDPLYSPGSDWIAEANTIITDLVTRDLNGEDVRKRILAFGLQYRTIFDGAVARTYTDHYPEFGNAKVMVAKLLWDFAFYWAIVAFPFMQGRRTDLELGAAVGSHARRAVETADQMGRLFRQWNELGSDAWRGTFIRNFAYPYMYELHRDLDGSFDDQALIDRFAENADVLDAIAVVIFHNALEDLPGHGIDADTVVNPKAVGLDPAKWDTDGLFNGTGLSMNDAMERAAGVERMLLSRKMQPV